MCGIAGIVSHDEQDHQQLMKMTDMMQHRGPDSHGQYQDSLVSLGHRRLSIIDLSDAGSQPMCNEDSSIYLVCNGELYNYLDVTKDLLAKDHYLKSKSDSEILLHLYEEYGDNFLDNVNGMFAFILWDKRERRLLAAVDRFGKKPLYYVYYQGKLLLASEMKSLLIFPWVNREIDPLAIDRYLTLRYVPAPLSMFKMVRKLEPSTMLIWQNGEIKIKPYWFPKRGNDIPFNEHTVDEFQTLFSDAVQIRLQSDVPLGLYLSGGIDSSAIAGCIHSLASKPLVTYTLSLDYKYNEKEKAQRIAEYLGYEFNPVTIQEDYFNEMPKIMYHLDEPFGDLLSLPAYFLARKAKEKLTVVLTGDGADEIFMGYFHQRLMMLRHRWRLLFNVPGMDRLLEKSVSLMPVSFMNLFFDYPDKIQQREKRKLVQTITNSRYFGTFYEGITSCFTSEDKGSLYLPQLVSHICNDCISDEIEHELKSYADFTYPSQLSLLDLKYWIPFSVIFRLDKMNMGHAVETRSPFLDYRIVEMALNLSVKGKMYNGKNKIILRKIIERLYPPALREPGKQAFYMPLTSQYRNRYYKWVTSLLNEKTVLSRGLFQWPYIKDLLSAFQQNGSMLINRQLTSLAMLELWFNVFVDNRIN